MTSNLNVIDALYKRDWNSTPPVYVDVSGVTSLLFLFNGWNKMTAVDPLETSSCVQMSQMFSSCSLLKTAPVMDTANVTDFSNMFQSCAALTSVPAYNLTKATTLGSMFSSCNSLPSHGDINAPLCANVAGMFSGCGAMTSVGNMTFGTLTSSGIANLFFGCTLLTSIGTINSLGSATSLSGMFQGCANLVDLPALTTTNITNLQNAFSGCGKVVTMPAYNFANVTNYSSAFTNMFLMTSFLATGMNASFSVASSALGAAALNTMFGNLSASGAGKTVTITGTPGAATCDRTIATAKGWTVTG